MPGSPSGHQQPSQGACHHPDDFGTLRTALIDPPLPSLTIRHNSLEAGTVEVAC